MEQQARGKGKKVKKVGKKRKEKEFDEKDERTRTNIKMVWPLHPHMPLHLQR